MTAPFLDDLRRAVAEADPADLPALVGALEQARAAAWARITSPPAPAPPSGGADQLAVDLPTAAKISGLPEQYMRVLARQRRIPTIRPPSTKPGRASGKYVRIAVEDLRRFLIENRDPGMEAKRA